MFYWCHICWWLENKHHDFINAIVVHGIVYKNLPLLFCFLVSISGRLPIILAFKAKATVEIPDNASCLCLSILLSYHLTLCIPLLWRERIVSEHSELKAEASHRKSSFNSASLMPCNKEDLADTFMHVCMPEILIVHGCGQRGITEIFNSRSHPTLSVLPLNSCHHW